MSLRRLLLIADRLMKPQWISKAINGGLMSLGKTDGSITSRIVGCIVGLKLNKISYAFVFLPPGFTSDSAT